MHNLSMAAALGIWSELWQCYYGDNGYGSETAEIYAYRLRRDNPSRHVCPDSSYAREALSEDNRNAAASLVTLVSLFCAQNECKATIDGLTPGEWQRRVEDGYDHRCHVRIVRDLPG